jgi:predicted transglutaminase-like cysteine proteinase
MKLLNAVNRYVNGHVRQMTDWQAFGVEELWRRSGTGAGAVGDCEDLAIEKRYELIAAGVPANRLRFAVVFRSDVGLHTVLVVHLETGDMVLDNRTPWVDSWQRAPYQWIAIQSAADPMRWQKPAGDGQSS